MNLLFLWTGRGLIRFGLLVGVVTLGACQPQNPKPLKVTVGEFFPALQVQDFQGNKKVLSFSGDKVTILNIWATWCGPCRHEMPSLQRLSEKLNKNNFRVVGVSVDNDNYVAQEYLIDKKITFPNYNDPDMSVSNNVLGLRAYPSTFVINEHGVLMFIEEKWRYWDEPEMLTQIRKLSTQKK